MYSSSSTNRRSRDQEGSASYTPTPASTRGASSHSLDHADADSPLPSIEHAGELLGDERGGTVSLHNSPSPPVDIRLGELQLNDNARLTASRESSLLPGGFARLNLGSNTPPTPDRGGSLLPGRHSRRSSSQRRVIVRHEVNDEKQTEAFYNAQFQNALGQSKDLARRLSNVLSSSGLHTDESSAIHDIYVQAVDASNYSGPRHWKIGLVGDSGVGKSSLINSLLDVAEFAHASNPGRACTCAVTEFHYRDSPEYTIQVELFPRDMLLEQFKQLLQAYRRYHSGENGDSNDGEEEANLALHTFQAAFRDQPVLRREYLLQHDEQSIHNDFTSWIDRFAPSEVTDLITVSTANECSGRLFALTSESPATASSWPYIKRVIVSLRANILSKGLILVDLPGLRDSNSARRMITERYIVECDGVFAIANIGRALTDIGVDAVINIARRTRGSNVGIVCTRSEEIEPNEAIRDWVGEKRARLTELKHHRDSARQALREIRDELDENDDADEMLDLHMRERTLRRELKTREYELQGYMTITRNKEVITGLRNNYQQVQHVFCVSNKIYWKVREEHVTDAMRWLNLSGIMSLRRHCIGLVAEHQLRDATLFMREKVPALVSAVDLWVSSGSGRIAAETREQIRIASEEVERVLQREVVNVLPETNGMSFNLDRYFDRWRQRNITNRNDQAWREAARHAAEDWNGWHQGSYAAFCRNWGDYQTPAVGSRCWNEEMLSAMKNSLEQPWTQLCSIKAKGFLERRSLGVDTSFYQALSHLQNIDSFKLDRDGFDSVQTLVQALLHRKALLKAETLELTLDFEGQLARLGDVELLSSIRTSLIGKHMETAYRAAMNDGGSGVKRRQQERINNRIGDRNIFVNMVNELETQFRLLTQDLQVRTQEITRRHFRAVRSDLDILRNETVALEAEQDLEFTSRLREEVVVAKESLAEIVRVIESL